MTTERDEPINERLASETIFDGKFNVIPMCDVAFVNKDTRPEWKGCVTIILKCSKWNDDTISFEPNIYLPAEEARRFMNAWTFYRSEIDPVRKGP
jgi:hypothetical protein